MSFHLFNLPQKELTCFQVNRRKVLCDFPLDCQTGFTKEFPKAMSFYFPEMIRAFSPQCARSVHLPAWHHFVKCECQILYSFKLATPSCNSSVCLFKKKKKTSRDFSLCLFKLHLIRAPICPSLIAFPNPKEKMITLSANCNKPLVSFIALGEEERKKKQEEGKKDRERKRKSFNTQLTALSKSREKTLPFQNHPIHL